MTWDPSITWYILVIGNYCVNYQIFQNSLLLTSSDTKRTLMHQFNSCLQIPPRVRRVYATAINFPCITFLFIVMYRTVQYYCTVMNQTELHCSEFVCTAIYCNLQNWTALYCTVLYYNILYCSALYWTVLHYYFI